MIRKTLLSFYDRIAGKYDILMNLTGYTLINRMIFKTLPDHFVSPEVLDLGCGTGITTRLVRERFRGAKVTGLDASDRMLNIYATKFPQHKVLLGDFNQDRIFYSYPDRNMVTLLPGSFDMVVSSGAVLEYGDLETIFALIHKLLRNGGMAVIIGTRKNFITDLIGPAYWKYKALPTEEILSLIEQAGFNNISNKANNSHFPIRYFKEIIIAYK